MKNSSLIIMLCLMACSKQLTDGYITSSSGLRYRIIKPGTGTPAKAGNTAFIFETTTYRDGTVLYSNENSDRAIPVLIGGNQATEAVDEGLRGMRAGEIRELVAPPLSCEKKILSTQCFARLHTCD